MSEFKIKDEVGMRKQHELLKKLAPLEKKISAQIRYKQEDVSHMVKLLK